MRALPIEEASLDAVEGPVLAEQSVFTPHRWRLLMGGNHAFFRRWVVLVGIADVVQRARLLGKGFGDVLGVDISLAEVQARARRVGEQAQCLPRWRVLAGLSLDLLQREAFHNQRPLGLHPREFLLLWRLMEVPGKPVDKRELLRDVWHLSYVPETNSVAVHASRLRAKLAAGGLAGWVTSTAGGGYRLTPAGDGTDDPVIAGERSGKSAT